MTIQQENEIAIETNALTEVSNQQTPLPLTTPTKADIILDLITLREELKQLRDEIKNDRRRPSKKLSTELYITQLIMQANKIILQAYKETNINVSNTTNVDISNQINELIKISRGIEERKKQKSQASATN